MKRTTRHRLVGRILKRNPESRGETKRKTIEESETSSSMVVLNTSQLLARLTNSHSKDLFTVVSVTESMFSFHKKYKASQKEKKFQSLNR